MPWLPINEEFPEMDYDLGYATFFPKGNLRDEKDAARAARDWCVRAKQAEEIQLARGWSVERWSGGKWHLTEYSCEDSFHADWNENGFDTPNDCLVANDEWFLAYEAEGLT